jgi:hypothetical protein
VSFSTKMNVNSVLPLARALQRGKGGAASLPRILTNALPSRRTRSEIRRSHGVVHISRSDAGAPNHSRSTLESALAVDPGLISFFNRDARRKLPRGAIAAPRPLSLAIPETAIATSAPTPALPDPRTIMHGVPRCADPAASGIASSSNVSHFGRRGSRVRAAAQEQRHRTGRAIAGGPPIACRRRLRIVERGSPTIRQATRHVCAVVSGLARTRWELAGRGASAYGVRSRSATLGAVVAWEPPSNPRLLRERCC